MNAPTNNRPLQIFREGAVNIKIWRQEKRDGTPYVNLSVGRSYKDERSGAWKDSRSFGDLDLLKLQALIPEAREELKKWQEYFRMQEQEHGPESEQESPPEKQPARDMTAERDAALQAAKTAPEAEPQEYDLNP